MALMCGLKQRNETCGQLNESARRIVRARSKKGNPSFTVGSDMHMGIQKKPVVSIGCPSFLALIAKHVFVVAALAWWTPAAVAQRDMGCSPTLANPCTGRSSGWSSDDNRGAEEAGRSARRWVDCKLFGKGCPDQNQNESRQSQGLELNERGVQAYNRGDWASAAAYFQQALQYSPDDSVIAQNLANARAKLQEVATAQARQNSAAAEKMRQSIQSLAQSLGAASEKGGLEFDGRNSASASGGDGLDFIMPNRHPSRPNRNEPRAVVKTASPPNQPEAPLGNALQDNRDAVAPPVGRAAQAAPRIDSFTRGFDHGSGCFSQSAGVACSAATADQMQACVADYRAGFDVGSRAARVELDRAYRAGIQARAAGAMNNGASQADATGPCRISWIEAYNSGYAGAPRP